MSAVLLPNGEQQFFDNDGDPLALGWVTFYVPNTTTKKTTWQDAAKNTQNTNPIHLDEAGRAIIYGNGTYRQVVQDAALNTIWDQITTGLDQQGALGIALLRSDIPSTSLSVSTFPTIGYSVAGDIGTGAIYTSHGAGSGSPMAIQDADGTWYQLVIEPSVNVGATGAKGDGSTDDASAINHAMVLAGVGLTVLPSETFAVSGITTQEASNLIGNCAVLIPTGNNITVVSVDGSLTLQDGQFQLLHDFVIDGTGRTGITGIGPVGGGQNTTGASTIFDNVTVQNCDTNGFNFGSGQFLRTTNLQAYNNTGAGILVANKTAAGGGNSQAHYQPHLVANSVGIFVNGTRFLGGCLDVNFFDAQCLENTVCGAAFFAANATFYGGAPEANGTGSSTVTIDGQIVKKSSVYLNASTVNVINYVISEATVSPCFLLESNSVLNCHNLTGYGNSTGNLVSADSTSTVHFTGLFNCIGNVQNVGSWPDSIKVQSTPATFYGQPVLLADPTLPALYAAQAPILLASVVTPPTITYVEDANLGYCTSVAFAASAGTPSGANTARLVVTAAAGKDTIVTVLVKASADTSMLVSLSNTVSGFDLANCNVSLKAGKVTRVVLARAGIAAGNDTVWFTPNDSAGAALLVSNLQIYQGTTNDPAGMADINNILKNGAFWPGVTRATNAVISDKTSSVNVMGKYPGKQVWDTDDARPLWATGKNDTSTWDDGANTIVITPS